METLKRSHATPRHLVRTVATVALVVVATIGTGRSASAQTLVSQWTGMAPSQLLNVYVSNHDGDEVHGRLLALGPDTLTLLVGDAEQVIARSDIARIQRRDSLKNGAIAGAIVGAVLGLISSGLADCPDGYRGSCGSFALAIVPLSTAVYTGVGVAIDAATPGRTTIYDGRTEDRRTGRSRASGGRLAVSTGVSW